MKVNGLVSISPPAHGALTEARVPFSVSHPVSDAYRQRATAAPLDSYRIFEFAINGVEVAA